MLPSLADLDVHQLSDEARQALEAGQLIADGASLDEAADQLGITLEQLKLRLEKLAAEWREQSGAAVLPKLTEDEYDALKASIERYGQIYPILCAADGDVVDGRHRARACRELGLEPKLLHLAEGTGADELRALEVAVNLARRQLTAASRRGIVRDELLRDASRSDRAIALSVGCSHPYVASVRRELEHAGDVEAVSTRVDRNGVARPATQPERPEKELPVGEVDVTLRIDHEIAADLEASGWLECRAIRLVLVDAGTYSLEVRT